MIIMSGENVPKTRKVGKWYFGGLAGSAAACCTNPMDLVKVHMQTPGNEKFGVVGTGVRVFRTDGVRGFFNGLTAAILRQMTFTLVRFGVYDFAKENMETRMGRSISFGESIGLSGVTGLAGGIAGNPADVIVVRMQNDVKLAIEKRRNYRNVFDGLWRTVRTEGLIGLTNGTTMCSTRAALLTIGQISFYAKSKELLLMSNMFKDNVATHFTASFLAGGVATLLTMPMEVLKTRMQNETTGIYSGLLDCAKQLARSSGPMGFFKGFVPSFLRNGQHTVFLFIFYEQLRLRFGDNAAK